MNVVDFLKARIAEDEVRAAAYAAATGGSLFGKPKKGDRLVAQIPSPSRLIDECSAKRRIIGLYEAFGRSDEPGAAAGWGALGEVLKDLASVYEDHPDYQKV